MALADGTRLGRYEVQAPLGSGGMGEVYRARDATLNRDVALKLLPEPVALDRERIARLKREAQMLAALNHPNIAAIYGFEESNGLQALVLELVNGPTLADRITEGPVAVDEALTIARQIAAALEAAHEQGIVHRDLKPANVKLRPDGTVKVLDFGLAKAMEPAGAAVQDTTASPTITSPALTQLGVILGTAAYMSPEQAKGRAADKRSDVWAFGCVLYEMLTGRRVFECENVSETLAAVLRGEPDWTVMPAEVPGLIRTLLKGCLAKDRRDRIAELSTVMFLIDRRADLVSGSTAAARAAAPVALWRKAIPAAAAIVVGLAAAYSAWMLKPAERGPVTRFAMTLNEGDAFTPSAGVVALSPDGSRLAYTANNRLYIRELDQLDATSIAGGDSPGSAASPRTPFFSPDGQWLGFWQSSQLKKVPVSGGAAVALCSMRVPPQGASWAADNTILVGDGAAGIWRVSGNGGTLERIIAVGAGQRAHGPQLLPDGRTILFTLAQTASWDEALIVAQRLDGGTRHTLVTGGTGGRYLPTGHLVYALRNTLMAVPFNAAALTVGVGPVPMVERVWRQAASGGAQFSVSTAGSLVYVPRPNVTALRTLAWVDRQGREEAIAAPPRPYRNPRISPDGTRLAMDLADDSENEDIWVWEFRRETPTRVTSDPAPDRDPAWSPDGQRIIFDSWRTGVISLFSQPANGSGAAEQLIELNRQLTAAPTISPDGRYLILRYSDALGSAELRFLDLVDGKLPAGGKDTPRPLVDTPFEEYNGEISPDGRWLAYQSNRSGTFEVYVQPFPDVSRGLWAASKGGGTEPLWARDGRELFYRGANGALMRVPVTPGSTWNASTPAPLFDARTYLLDGNRSYDVSRDGRQFLMMKDSQPGRQASTAPRMVVVQNWFEELKARAPAK